MALGPAVFASSTFAPAPLTHPLPPTQPRRTRRHGEELRGLPEDAAGLCDGDRRRTRGGAGPLRPRRRPRPRARSRGPARARPACHPGERGSRVVAASMVGVQDRLCGSAWPHLGTGLPTLTPPPFSSPHPSVDFPQFGSELVEATAPWAQAAQGLPGLATLGSPVLQGALCTLCALSLLQFVVQVLAFLHRASRDPQDTVSGLAHVAFKVGDGAGEWTPWEAFPDGSWGWGGPCPASILASPGWAPAWRS